MFMYKIYRITNLANGKIYIGQTKQALKQRFNEHASRSTSALHEAINKYGRESFKIDVLDETELQSIADEREKYWTEFYKSNDENFGYNIAVVKTRIGKTNGFYGKHHTQECIKRNQEHQPNRVMVMCVDTGRIFQSLREAERVTGISKVQIKRICNGKAKRATKKFIYANA